MDFWSDLQFKQKIDFYFESIISHGSNLIGKGDFNVIEQEMSVKRECPFEGCNYWKPIKSTVVDIDIEKLEKEIGCKLPVSYIKFLKYKHFYELHIEDCAFVPHPINAWKSNLLSAIQEDVDMFLNKGYIVFAYHLPEGAYCFDTGNKKEDCNYPIVLWTPENPIIESEYEPNSFTFQFKNFESMMNNLDNSNMLFVDNNAR